MITPLFSKGLIGERNSERSRYTVTSFINIVLPSIVFCLINKDLLLEFLLEWLLESLLEWLLDLKKLTGHSTGWIARTELSFF